MERRNSEAEPGRSDGAKATVRVLQQHRRIVLQRASSLFQSRNDRIAPNCGEGGQNYRFSRPNSAAGHPVIEGLGQKGRLKDERRFMMSGRAFSIQAPVSENQRQGALGERMRTFRLFGLPIVDQTIEEAVDDVIDQIHGAGPRSLYFVNAHTLNTALADPSYYSVLSRAGRVYGDGAGVRWAARNRGFHLRANLNGTDLVPRVLTQGRNIRCFIVGSAPERTAAIAKEFRRLFPTVELVGAHHGYLDDAASRKVIEAINASGANLVLVGMGNPIQENWIDRYGSGAPSALCVGVGGLLEYWSGALDRAPLWIRKAGLEWVHIMLRQPWKAKRYIVGNPLYVMRALMHRRTDRLAPALIRTEMRPELG
jgi:N-acetylglucosaminyldiphosphoundecaprenol N-acetyl-beta-D-mannosaminyltransferase